MVRIIRRGVYYTEGRIVKEAQAFMTSDKKERAALSTMSAQIAKAAIEVPSPAPFAATKAQFAREEKAVSGKRIACMGCGALGALSFCGESTQKVAVFLRGKLKKGTDPVDVVLSVLKADKGFLKGKLLEFMGVGVSNLSMEERIAIDEGIALTGACATLWQTDGKTRDYFAAHMREEDFRPLAPSAPAYYDGAVIIDLTRIVPMAGISEKEIYPVEGFDSSLLPFETPEIAVLYGCGYETLATLAEGKNGGMGSILCEVASTSVLSALDRGGYISELLEAGVMPFPPQGLKEEGMLYSDGFHAGALFVSPQTAAASVSAGKLTIGSGRTRRLKKYEFAPTRREETK